MIYIDKINNSRDESMEKLINERETFFCNLHDHSKLSDGKLSEEQLISYAIEVLGTNGVLAITDHNVVSENIKALIKKYSDQIELVPGCEVSASYTLSTGRIVHLHINLLFLNPDSLELKNMLMEIKGDHDSFLLKSIDVLEKNTQFRMSLDELKLKFDGCEQIGRKHIATCLVEQGIYDTETDALDNCIGRMKEPFCYVDASEFFPDEPAMKTVLSVGKAAHSLAVLCHPLFYNLKESELHELVYSFATLSRQIGIPYAMEIEYSAYSREEKEYLYSLKEEYQDMLVSCGSDFHGWGSDSIEAFPGEIFLKLKETHKVFYAY